MAITVECPRCSHRQKIDDDKIGKGVPCKICHHLIKSGGNGEKAKSKLAGADKEDKHEGVHAGPPKVESAGAKTKPQVAASKRKRADQDDDDVPEPRPVPPARRESTAASSMLPMALIGGGAFVLLALLCGGGGVGGYFLFRSAPKADEQVAQKDGPEQQEPKKDEEMKPDPGPKPGPPPNEPFQPPPFNPPPFQPPPFQPPPFDPPPFQPPPQPVRLNPNDPAQFDKALALLAGPDQDREAAYHWFAAADTNHKRRVDAAKQFEKLVDVELQRPFTKFFDAYFRWYTTDNVASLMRFAESNAFTPWDNDRRQKSMVALGKLREPRAVENIASKLNNAFDGDTAYNALVEMGPVAQGTMLKYFNDPDGRTRDRVRTLLQGYNTNPQFYFAQTLIDLDSAENGRRDGALQWLAKSPVDDKRRAEVSRALNKSLDNPDCLRNPNLVGALENWGTTENVSKLAQIIDQSRFGNGAAIKILGKIGDADSIKIIARSMNNTFNLQEAKNALKAQGAKAELAVIETMNGVNNPKDRRLRDECIRLLGEIGTRNVSGTALQQLALRNPNDRPLGLMITQSLTAINARGK